MKTIILIAIIAAVASPIFADEQQQAIEAKKQDKRGALGLGYGAGYYNGLAGYSGLGYGGYGAYGASPLTAYGGVLPTSYSHAASPYLSTAYHNSIYNAASPYRFGYNGYNGYNGLGLAGHGLGFGFGHGLNYQNNYLQGGHVY